MARSGRWQSKSGATAAWRSSRSPRTSRTAGGSRWQRERSRAAGSGRSAVFGLLLGLVALTGAIFCGYLLLTWFSPVPPPRLVTLAAHYRRPGLVPNDAGARDAALLHAQTKVFARYGAGLESLDGGELAADVAGLATLPLAPQWVFAEPPVALVYVSALGVVRDGADGPEAVLLPEGVDLSEPSAAVPLATLLARLTDNPAPRKVLVLDCQRQRRCVPLGAAEADFATAAASDWDGLPAARKVGLFVVTSCGAGEIAWVDPATGHSVFADAFAHGLAGAADGFESAIDGRVSLAVAFDYAAVRVRQWAPANRSATQSPNLTTFGQNPAAVELVALDRTGDEFVPPPEAPRARATELDSLAAAWATYAQRAAAEPAPWLVAPAAWTAYDASLRRAENYWLTAPPEAVAAELAIAAVWRQVIDEAAAAAAVAGTGFSLPAAAAAGDADDFARAVADFRAGAADLTTTAGRLRELAAGGDAVPAEAVLLLRADGRVGPREDDRVRRLLASLDAAERAATAAGVAMPLVFADARAAVDTADQGRRVAADRWFAEPGVAVGSPGPVDADWRRLYGTATADAMQVAEAEILRRLVLTELPRWTAWAVALHDAVVPPTDEHRAAAGVNVGQDEPLRRRAAAAGDQVGRLAEAAARLDGLLDQPAGSAERRDRIRSAAEAVRATRDRLRGAVGGAADRLLADATAPATPAVWLELDALRHAPLPVGSELPEQRRTLLERLRREIVPDGSPAPKEMTDAPPAPAVAPTPAELHARLDALADGDGRPAEEPAAARWRRLHRLAGTTLAGDLTTDDLRRTWRAEILRAEFLRPATAGAAGRLLWRRARSRHFGWQAGRRANDFIGPVVSATPYWRGAAETLRRVAEDLAPASAPTPWLDGLDARLRQLNSAAATVLLRPDRLTLYRSSGPATVTATVGDTLAAVPGVRRVDLADDAGLLRIGANGEVHSGAVGYRVAGTQASGQTRLTATLSFRGHRATATVPVTLDDDQTGPTVVYRDERPASALVSVRRVDTPAAGRTLMLVLDSSRSMNAGSPSRLQTLQTILRRFAAEVPAGSLDVGVRVFGSKVRWTDAATEAAARDDTTLVLPPAPFDPDRFEGAVGGLRGVGESPLFAAVAAAYADVADLPGDRDILVISDGGDNWFADEAVEKLDALRELFAGGDATVHTVGFRTDAAEFDQLRRIATLGGGEATVADDADDLFARVTGLLGPLRCRVVAVADQDAELGVDPLDDVLQGGDARAAAPPPRPLTADARAVRLDAGVYRVEVLDRTGSPVAELPRLRLRGGQRHQLLFRDGRISWDAPRLPEPLATARDDRVRLAVLQAQPIDDEAGPAVRMQVALWRPADPQWWPRRVRLLLKVEHDPAVFPLAGVPANEPGWHVPVWTFTLRRWPAGERRARLTATWAGDASATPATVLDWTTAAASLDGPPLPTGWTVETSPAEPRDTGAGVRPTATARVRAPLDALTAWIVRPPETLSYLEQTLNPSRGLLTATYALRTDGTPRHLVAIAPPAADGTTLVTGWFRVQARALTGTEDGR